MGDIHMIKARGKVDDNDLMTLFGPVLIGDTASKKVAFFGATPVSQQSALTTALTAITHTAPGTADYAIQDLTTTTPYGFVTKDEGNTVLSVVKNNAARIAEIETALSNLGLIA